MKFLLYLVYFVRSVRWRGLGNTVRLLRAELRYDKQFGIHTSAIKESRSTEFYHYQGASYLVLLRLFKELPALISASHAVPMAIGIVRASQTFNIDFVDIGCGKGRALFVAEYCGFEHLTGIELDASLLEEAKENLKRYVFKRSSSSFHFINANALAYAYKNEAAVYFLFNPFSENILKQVLTNIVSATTEPTWFIYMNPQYKQIFEAQGLELVKVFKTWRYTEAVMYYLPKR